MKTENHKKVLIVVIVISISTIFLSEIASCESGQGQEGKSTSAQVGQAQQDLNPFSPEHLWGIDFDGGTLQGWTLKKGANAITKLRVSQLEHVSGSSSLQMDVNVTKNNRVGEAFVKVPGRALKNCVVIAKIKPSSACAGPEDRPNCVLLFVRDHAGRGKFGMWRNPHARQWREIAVSVNRNAVPLGSVDEGFDPDRIVTVGLLFKLNEEHAESYSCVGQVFVDDVQIVRDGKGLDTAEAIPLRVGNSWTYERTVIKRGAPCGYRLLPCKDGSGFATTFHLQDFGLEERYEITGFDPTNGFRVKVQHGDMRNHRYNGASSVWWNIEKSNNLQGEGCGMIFEQIEYRPSSFPPGWGELVIVPAIEKRRLVFLWGGFYGTFSKIGLQRIGHPIQNSSGNLPETVQVPAGRFENCIKMVETCSRDKKGKDEKKDKKFDWQIFSYYCPGVGLVYEKGVDQDDEVIYEMELVKYSLGGN